MRVIAGCEAASGAWNMAVDEWLLGQAITDKQLTLRFYQWGEPTLSLGYFQLKSGLPVPEPLAHLPTVRRLTGGGAILHDRELTYSLVIPATHQLAATPTKLYAIVHEWIIAALAEQGIVARMRGQEQAERNGTFLCFLRGDRHDVMIGSDKILGSAQRRRKGAILQHGSLILSTSPLAQEIPGISELTGVDLDLALAESAIRRRAQQLDPNAEVWSPNDGRAVAQIRELELRYLNCAAGSTSSGP